ncbi:hypothetical protein BSQ39_08295 [Loigolactobacillus backii]|uniref:hypothetical protein n=1 Tax=Loigolactobacillus backii TaxID=375175 RepID=UPI000C1CC134|nr:hypothetical protein [Loigolactobacillus backii]PIO83563.1 hypothetical protein BSQ39_08295 [Loigolactobacillus backii]
MHSILAAILGYILARKFFLFDDDEPNERQKEVDNFVPSEKQCALIDHWADERTREDKQHEAA